MFVGYLFILAVLATLKQQKTANTPLEIKHFQRGSLVALIGIGIIAGFSSGLLGIGGGLAITALSVALLAVTALPLTLPAAWVYIDQRDTSAVADNRMSRSWTGPGWMGRSYLCKPADEASTEGCLRAVADCDGWLHGRRSQQAEQPDGRR